MEDWYCEALCLEVDADMFFADGPGNTLGPAKKVCRACPVRVECLAEELRHDVQALGVFGGFSRDARDQLRRRIERGQDRRRVAKVAIYRDLQRAS